MHRRRGSLGVGVVALLYMATAWWWFTVEMLVRLGRLMRGVW